MYPLQVRSKKIPIDTLEHLPLGLGLPTEAKRPKEAKRPRKANINPEGGNTPEGGFDVPPRGAALGSRITGLFPNSGNRGWRRPRPTRNPLAPISARSCR